MSTIVHDDIRAALDFYEDEQSQQLRVRLVMGYHLTSTSLYHFETQGAVYPLTQDECEERYQGDRQVQVKAASDRLIEKAELTWTWIPESGELRLAIYGWQLGMPYDIDDDGAILGNWPPIGVLQLPYDHKFLMPHGRLPDEWAWLRCWRPGNTSTSLT